MEPSSKNAPDKDKQSLAARTRDCRHELLQLFADLEIELGALLCDPRFKTFGQKLQEAIKRADQLKPHSDLNELRNLIAHAKFDIAAIDSRLFVVMRVSDAKSEFNARVIAGDDWTRMGQAWRKSVQAALDVVRNLPTAKPT